MAQSGDTVDLSGAPLSYTNDDSSLTGDKRAEIEGFEKKRGNAKIEYAYMLDENGKPVREEVKGKKGHVDVDSGDLMKTETFTHIHPRGKGEEGYLGGTFSKGDIATFTKYTADGSAHGKMKCFRAKATEGTYYIRVEKGFNLAGLKQYHSDMHKKFEGEVKRQRVELNKRYKTTKMDYNDYIAEYKNIWNRGMTSFHEDMIRGQAKYGYSYGLERVR